jgi:hypothetical protein
MSGVLDANFAQQRIKGFAALRPNPRYARTSHIRKTLYEMLGKLTLIVKHMYIWKGSTHG